MRAKVEFGAIINNLTGKYHPAIREHTSGECLINEDESFDTVMEASDRAEEIFLEIATKHNIPITRPPATSH